MSILRNTPFEAQKTLFPERSTFEPYVLTALVLLATSLVLRKLLSDGASLSHPLLDRFRAYEALPYKAASKPKGPGDTEHTLSEKISYLEEVEQGLVTQYRSVDVFGSVEAFYDAKARLALFGRDSNSAEALEMLPLVLLRFRNAYFASVQLSQMARLDACLADGYPRRCVDASRFWVVLIGVDAYRTYPLRGCVSDALVMEKYLTDDLGVPKERIQRLLGPTGDKSINDSLFPSRANIISSLLSLVQNPEITMGDNIIIYFSGHGTSYSPSDIGFDAETGSIEVLCPIDRGDLDANGIPIPDISDREINAILTEISRSKGHHITFILDCCHSGSLTRNMGSGIRTIPPLPLASLKSMLETADEKMKSFDGYRSILAKDWRPDMTSHVVLAACQWNQFAKEVKGMEGFNGVFTQALLDTLRSNKLTENSTYIDLIQALPHIQDQQPVVAGKCQDARLWYQ